MAENPSRFVIIDGVQIARERALRKGLINEDGDIIAGHPSETRARTQGSARRAGAVDAPATVVVADGAVATGEDAARAGAPTTDDAAAAGAAADAVAAAQDSGAVVENPTPADAAATVAPAAAPAAPAPAAPKRGR